jgi:hypothetical protein
MKLSLPRCAQEQGKTGWNSVCRAALRNKERQDETQLAALRSGTRKDRMKLSLPPKLLEQLVWVPVILLLCKSFIFNYVFDALLCWNWPFSPPNRRTSWINSIILIHFCFFPHPLGTIMIEKKKERKPMQVFSVLHLVKPAAASGF